jgi:uncharacterized protein with FMN-binding domain
MKTYLSLPVAACLILLCALFLFAGSSGEPPWRIEVLEAELRDIDLSKADDGVYTGRHEYRSKTYVVQAEVSDHRIVKIEIVEWDENDARAKALAVFDRVIER